MTASAPLTIGRLARAAGVGVETIRYYQRRNLLALPAPNGSAFRYYPHTFVDRIRFIKRAQELGFSLDEVATLLNLEDGKNRRSIRSVAAGHLAQIESRIADLKRMEASLSKLITDCADNEGALRCPIIAALSGTQSSAAQCARATRQSVR